MKQGISPQGNRLTRAEQLEILDRIAGGETRPVIADDLGTTERTVGRVIARAAGPRAARDVASARRFASR